MGIHCKMVFLVYHQRQLKNQGAGQSWASGENRGADGARIIVIKFDKDI